MKVKFSPSEEHLIQYINAHSDDIPALSIVSLSEVANVSTATIVRTMKKLGYEGYTSFKHEMKHTTNTSFEILDQVDQEIKQAILKNEQEVTRTIDMLDSPSIEDAVQKIHSAKRIYIFARGFSELLGKEMMLKLQLSGKYCEMHDDPNIIKIISTRLAQDDLAIFISLNGETAELIQASQNCVANDVTTLSITANEFGTLSRYSDILFVGYKSPISFFPDYEVRSRQPLQVIVRVLLDAYAIRKNKINLTH